MRTERTSQVVGQHVRAHLEVVDNHGRQGRSGVEEAAVHNQDVNVLGFQPCTADTEAERETGVILCSSDHEAVSLCIHGDIDCYCLYARNTMVQQPMQLT